MLLFVHEVELGRRSLEHAVPVEVDEGALLGDGALDALRELRGVLVVALHHRLQVEDVDDYAPAGHHEYEILEHGVLGAVPERVAEAHVVLDGDRIDGRLDLEAALLEHHHRRVVDARALGKDEYGHVGLVVDVVAHPLGHVVAIARVRAIEPDVLGRSTKGALHHAGEAAVRLADHRVAVVRGQDDHVDGRRVIGHANGAGLGAIVLVVEGDDGGEDARQYAMQNDGRVVVEPALERRIDVHHADEKGGDERVAAREYEQDEARRKEDAVAEDEAEQPEDGHAHAHVLVLLVGAREQIPHGELLGGEALGHVVVDDGLEAAMHKLDDVAEFERLLRLVVVVVAAAAATLRRVPSAAATCRRRGGRGRCCLVAIVGLVVDAAAAAMVLLAHAGHAAMVGVQVVVVPHVRVVHHLVLGRRIEHERLLAQSLEMHELFALLELAAIRCAQLDEIGHFGLFELLLLDIGCILPSHTHNKRDLYHICIGEYYMYIIQNSSYLKNLKQCFDVHLAQAERGAKRCQADDYGEQR